MPIALFLLLFVIRILLLVVGVLLIVDNVNTMIGLGYLAFWPTFWTGLGLVLAASPIKFESSSK